MNRDSLSRIVVFLVAIAALLIFSRMTVQSLAVMAFGGAIMLLAMSVYYRQGAVVGMLIVVAAAACCMELTTLTEVRMVFTALLGLLLPSGLLMWLALTADSGIGLSLPKLGRPFTVGAVYLLLCVVSVPIAALVVGFAFPAVSSRIEGLTEISIVLLVIAIGAVVLGTRDVKHVRASVRDELVEATE